MKTFGLVCEVDTLDPPAAQEERAADGLKRKGWGAGGESGVTNKMHFILRKCPQLKGHRSLPGTKW